MKGVEAKPLYEVGYHVVPGIAEDAVGAEVARIRESIEGHGGSVVSEEWPKSMRLAYTISRREQGGREHYDKAYFGWIRFEMDRSKLENVQEVLENTPSVLRFLSVEVSREKAVSKKRRARPVIKKTEDTAKDEASGDTAAVEELDREIEKLMVD